MNKFKTKEDIITHLSDDYSRFEGAIVPPVFLNSLFVTPTPGNGMPEHGNVYSRVSNPTVEIAEEKIAALEGGEKALCFSSGMAAISAAILYFIEKDCHIIALRDVYGGTYDLLKNYLPRKFGISVSFVDASNFDEIVSAVRPETKLIYLESPSSGVSSIQDLSKIGSFAREKGIGTVIDNTDATPLYQNPLKYGIDIVVHTATKYLGGHSDIMAGALVSTQEICASIQGNERLSLGAVLDPHSAWLLIRSMRTLIVRMRQHQENAFRIAEFLENHPRVKQVYYPGLKSHPQSALISRQMSGFGGLLSLTLKGGKEETEKFVYALKMFQFGCSWGGFESLVTFFTQGRTPEELDKSGIPQNLVRLHVGLENADTLIEDLGAALDKAFD